MKYVTLNNENHIAVLSINRPKSLNALNSSTINEIIECIDAINKNDDIRVMIIYSQKNFAAGADISEMVKCDYEKAMEFKYSSAYNIIEKMEIPTISAIEGYALGGGMELALATDIRFAGKSSKIGFPEVSLGLFPGAGGSIRLPKLIGSAKAKELIFSGEIIDAQKANSIGLVNRVVDDDKVLSEAVSFAELIISRSPIAVKTAKKSIDYAMDEKDINKSVLFERKAWAGLFDTKEKEEGMTAFLEKRKPEF